VLIELVGIELGNGKGKTGSDDTLNPILFYFFNVSKTE